jgi:hypothetical protein
MKKHTKTRLAIACGCLLATVTSQPASAAFVVDGGTTQGLPVAGNDFNSQLTMLGFSQMTSGGQLRVNRDGFIDFHLVGAESSYINSFSSGTETLTENNQGFSSDGYGGFTITVSANDIVDFRFDSNSSGALKPVDNAAAVNLQRLGIFFGPSQGGEPGQVFLGYDDQLYSADHDFDDMLIRADFRLRDDHNGSAVVPLPGAFWLFGAGLAALGGFARRQG